MGHMSVLEFPSKTKQEEKKKNPQELFDRVTWAFEQAREGLDPVPQLKEFEQDPEAWREQALTRLNEVKAWVEAAEKSLQNNEVSETLKARSLITGYGK